MSKRSGLADSPFFSDSATSDKPVTQTDSATAVPGVPPVRGVLDVRDERSGLPVPAGRPAFPPKRPLKRHPFDIYADQLERLKALKAQAMRRGEEASMSRMVREALEQYIERRL